MELRHVRYFLALGDELHFGRAARRLGVSQPPLSVALRELEDELGEKLFERTSRHVAPTPAGLAFRERAMQILSIVEAARRDTTRAARGEVGTIGIGYTTAATYGLLTSILVRFRRARPDVRLHLQEMRSDDVATAVRTSALDCGLVCLPVVDDGLTSRVLCREPIVVAIPASHPLAARDRIPVRLLDGLPAVQARPTLEPAWAREGAACLARCNVALDVVEEADTKLAVLALVAAGIGIAVVARSTMALGRPGVVFRPVTGLSRTALLRMGIISRRGGGATNPTLPAFLDAAVRASVASSAGGPS